MIFRNRIKNAVLENISSSGLCLFFCVCIVSLLSTYVTAFFNSIFQKFLTIDYFLLLDIKKKVVSFFFRYDYIIYEVFHYATFGKKIGLCYHDSDVNNIVFRKLFAFLFVLILCTSDYKMYFLKCFHIKKSVMSR